MDDRDRLLALLDKEKILNERLIRHRTMRETAEKELLAVQKQATDEFGTDNIDELRKLYKKYSEENKLALDNFEKSLIELENNLNIVDTKLEQINA